GRTRNQAPARAQSEGQELCESAARPIPWSYGDRSPSIYRRAFPHSSRQHKEFPRWFKKERERTERTTLIVRMWRHLARVGRSAVALGAGTFDNASAFFPLACPHSSHPAVARPIPV